MHIHCILLYKYYNTFPMLIKSMLYEQQQIQRITAACEFYKIHDVCSSTEYTICDAYTATVYAKNYGGLLHLIQVWSRCTTGLRFFVYELAVPYNVWYTINKVKSCARNAYIICLFIRYHPCWGRVSFLNIVNTLTCRKKRIRTPKLLRGCICTLLHTSCHIQKSINHS